MRSLLLLGGMTPAATTLYYNTINRIVQARLGGRNAAPLYLYSANLETMLQYLSAGDLDAFAQEYIRPINALAVGQQQGQKTTGGLVDGVAVCAIIAHKVSRQISEVLAPSGVPLLHIADFLAAHIKAEHPNARRIGLLGPKITMLGADDPDFFLGKLQSAPHDFDVLVPDTLADVDEVNRGMLDEVARGAAAVTEATRAMFVRQADALVARGARVIVLGSTDLGFVFEGGRMRERVPVVEPAAAHAEGLARWICEE